MQITTRKVAEFHYTLTNGSKEVLDSSREREPMAYVHGANNIVKGLEQAMEGKQAGDKFQVEVAPADGYGQRIDALVQSVPRDAFQGIDNVEPGMRFQAETQQGPITVMVTDVAEDQVTVDGNHPLAGQPLHFDIEVVSVREATDEEVEHGHTHGEDEDEDEDDHAS